jgi:hypothetical protein
VRSLVNKLTSGQRAKRALLSGGGCFAGWATAYKLGYRGKYTSGDPLTTWAELASALPTIALGSTLLAGVVYFWLGRGES